MDLWVRELDCCAIAIVNAQRKVRWGLQHAAATGTPKPRLHRNDATYCTHPSMVNRALQVRCRLGNRRFCTWLDTTRSGTSTVHHICCARLWDTEVCRIPYLSGKIPDRVLVYSVDPGFASEGAL